MHNTFIRIIIFCLSCCFVSAYAQQDTRQKQDEDQIPSDLMEIRTLKNMGLNVSYGNTVRLLMTGHDKFEDPTVGY